MDISAEIEMMFEEANGTAHTGNFYAGGVRFCDSVFNIDNDEIKKESLADENKINLMLKKIAPKQYLPNYLKKSLGII